MFLRRHSNVMFNMSDFRSEDRWFEAWSRHHPVVFLRQETLLHIVSCHARDYVVYIPIYIYIYI